MGLLELVEVSKAALMPSLMAACESPLFAPCVLAAAAGLAIGSLVLQPPPWNHQKPTDMKWTASGIAWVRELDSNLLDTFFGSPTAGAPMTADHIGVMHKFNVFTDQLLSRGLATGTMAPRKFGFFGTFYDFSFMAAILVGGIGTISLGAYAAGVMGYLSYARPPTLVAAHLFAYLYVCLHTTFVFFAHLAMANDASKVEAAIAQKTANYHLTMWSEQAKGNGPKGSHPYDAHTWPPLVYLPPTAVPLYQKGYILVDLPGIALLLCGSAYAYPAIWACYLCAALTDHLFLFGGPLSERVKTILPVRGINMAQYSMWVILAHLSAPGVVSVLESLAMLGKIFVVAAPTHLAMMYAIGGRKSRRP